MTRLVGATESSRADLALIPPARPAAEVVASMGCKQAADDFGACIAFAIWPLVGALIWWLVL